MFNVFFLSGTTYLTNATDSVEVSGKTKDKKILKAVNSCVKNLMGSYKQSINKIFKGTSKKSQSTQSQINAQSSSVASEQPNHTNLINPNVNINDAPEISSIVSSNPCIPFPNNIISNNVSTIQSRPTDTVNNVSSMQPSPSVLYPNIQVSNDISTIQPKPSDTVLPNNQFNDGCQLPQNVSTLQSNPTALPDLATKVSSNVSSMQTQPLCLLFPNMQVEKTIDSIASTPSNPNDLVCTNSNTYQQKEKNSQSETMIMVGKEVFQPLSLVEMLDSKNLMPNKENVHSKNINSNQENILDTPVSIQDTINSVINEVNKEIECIDISASNDDSILLDDANEENIKVSSSNEIPNGASPTLKIDDSLIKSIKDNSSMVSKKNYEKKVKKINDNSPLEKKQGKCISQIKSNRYSLGFNAIKNLKNKAKFKNKNKYGSRAPIRKNYKSLIGELKKKGQNEQTKSGVPIMNEKSILINKMNTNSLSNYTENSSPMNEKVISVENNNCVSSESDIENSCPMVNENGTSIEKTNKSSSENHIEIITPITNKLEKTICSSSEKNVKNESRSNEVKLTLSKIKAKSNNNCYKIKEKPFTIKESIKAGKLPLETSSNSLDDDIKEIKIEPNKNSPKKKKNRIDYTEKDIEMFFEPLKRGYRRLLVHRNSVAVKRGDIYYFNPNGKKFRSKPEIMKYLTQIGEKDLNQDHFSFYDKLLGFGSPYETEKNAESYRRTPKDEPVSPKVESNSPKVESNLPKSKSESPKTKLVPPKIKSVTPKRSIKNKPSISIEEDEPEDSFEIINEEGAVSGFESWIEHECSLANEEVLNISNIDSLGVVAVDEIVSDDHFGHKQSSENKILKESMVKKASNELKTSVPLDSDTMNDKNPINSTAKTCDNDDDCISLDSNSPLPDVNLEEVWSNLEKVNL